MSGLHLIAVSDQTLTPCFTHVVNDLRKKLLGRNILHFIDEDTDAQRGELTQRPYN